MADRPDPTPMTEARAAMASLDQAYRRMARAALCPYCGTEMVYLASKGGWYCYFIEGHKGTPAEGHTLVVP